MNFFKIPLNMKYLTVLILFLFSNCIQNKNILSVDVLNQEKFVNFALIEKYYKEKYTILNNAQSSNVFINLYDDLLIGKKDNERILNDGKILKKKGIHFDEIKTLIKIDSIVNKTSGIAVYLTERYSKKYSKTNVLTEGYYKHQLIISPNSKIISEISNEDIWNLGIK